MRRLFQHLFYSPWRLRQCFPRPVLDAIEHEIIVAENHHRGEIRFVIEANLDLLQLWRGTSARTRALELFSQLHVWDTEENSGVLVYLLLAERRVEIVADRGITAKVSPASWERVCQGMSEAFQRGQFETGALQGIRDIDAQLTAHFPTTGARPNELPNQPLVLE